MKNQYALQHGILQMLIVLWVFQEQKIIGGFIPIDYTGNLAKVQESKEQMVR